MFARLFNTRPTDTARTNARENNVRQLDGQWIIIVARYDNGMIDYRYEEDRTNAIYSTAEVFCR